MKIKIPTREQVHKLQDQAKRITQYKEAIKTIKSGGPEHKFAKEAMLARLIQDQEKVLNALIRKAKAGDTNAIKEFFDRLYGKSKETVDFNQNVTFSLKELAEKRRLLQQRADEHIRDVIITDPTQVS
jgi:hypothetical protein